MWLLARKGRIPGVVHHWKLLTELAVTQVAQKAEEELPSEVQLGLPQG